MNINKWHWQSIAMISERCFKLLGGVFVSLILARYLGPEQFGLLIFSQTVVMILVALSALGTDVLSVKWYLSEKYDNDALLLSITIIRLCMATLIQVTLFGLLFFIEGNAIKFIFVLGWSLFFSSFDTIYKLFEYRGKGYKTAFAKFLGFIISAILKLAFVYYDMELSVILYAVISEVFLSMLLLVWIYKKESECCFQKVIPFSEIKVLLNKSFPLLISTVTALLYNATGIFVLKMMMGDEAVGIYSVATRVSEAWFSLLSITVVSITPKIIMHANNFKGGNKESSKELLRYYGVVAYLCIGVSLVMTFISNWLIVLLFGEIYSDASIVLTIHMWSGIFVAWRYISGKILIAQDLIRQHIYRFIFGLLCNLILCFISVPIFGVIGAALSALFSHILVGYFSDLFNIETREQFFLKTSSLNLKKYI